MLKVRRIDGHPASVQIGAHDFACEDETGHVVIPREFAAGFRLSDIPEDISIKPVERIEGHRQAVFSEGERDYLQPVCARISE
jgi:hypothetical protein